MLQINRKTDYAVRVVLALAKQPRGTRLATGTIQREMLIPGAFLPRIVAQLANAGLVKTYPGRDGGLELPHPAHDITLRDVVEVFEGPLLLSECMESHGADDCPFHGGCPVTGKWGRIQAAMVREMASITFKDLADEAVEMAGIRSGNHTRRGTRVKK